SAMQPRGRFRGSLPISDPRSSGASINMRPIRTASLCSRRRSEGMTIHIAQLNIGRFRYSTGDPRMADFMMNLDRINALAERTDGFVWRLKDDSNNATAIRPTSDPTMAVNLSVWESVEALERFVWATVHKQFYNRKGDWFEKSGSP